MRLDQALIRRVRWIKLIALSIVIAVFTGLSVQLWTQTNQKLDTLRSSAADNVIWTVSQMEVEFLALLLALERLQKTPQDPLAVETARRRFDVYFSRIDTLLTSPAHKDAIEFRNSVENLRELERSLDLLVVIFDRPDPIFAAQAPIAIDVLDSQRRLVRQVSAWGMLNVSAMGDRTRADLTSFLLQFSIVVLMLMGFLASLSVMLWNMNRHIRTRAAERALSNARMTALISTSPDAIVVTDGVGRIVEFNRVAEELLGVARDRAVGRRFGQYLLGPDQTTTRLPFVGKGRVSGIEMTLQAQDDRQSPVEISQGVAQIEKDKFFVYFLRNISERKLAEENLRASRDSARAADRAKSRFLAVMSHEMRTPLNGILGLAQLMRDDKVLSPEERKEYLGMLQGSAQILLEHVNEVLDIAQLEANGVQLVEEPFDMDALINGFVGPMQVVAERRNNSFTVEKSPDPLGWFVADTRRFRQIITNLTGNALKFTDNGEVSLSIAVFDKGQTADVEIQIADTGVGIPEDEQQRIFDDFARIENNEDDHREGTGLGLGIAKRIVDAMGGEIGVDSIPGEGSVFWINLTLPKSAPQASDTTDLVTHEDTSSALYILVVEDNPTNRFVIREMLERDGHQVIEANNGLEGAMKAAEERFDLILMDINMPVLGGVEATRMIRKEGESMNSRIFALTAHVYDQDGALYREAGMDAVLSKPLHRSRLREALRGQSMPKDIETNPDLIVDVDQVKQVLVSIGKDRGRILFDGFYSETQSLLSALQDSAPSDQVKLAERVHNLSGVAAMVGTRRFRNALNELEKLILDGDTLDQSGWAKLLSAIWAETEAELISIPQVADLQLAAQKQ